MIQIPGVDEANTNDDVSALHQQLNNQQNEIIHLRAQVAALTATVAEIAERVPVHGAQLSVLIGLSNQTEQRLEQKSAEMDQEIAQIRGLVEVATTDTRNVETNVGTRTKAFAEAVEQLECRIEEHDQAIDELINSEAEGCTCDAKKEGNSPGEE